MKENIKNTGDNGCDCTENRNKEIDLGEHWDKTYSEKAEEKLGWYETEFTLTLNLIAKSGISKASRILLAGAGCTRLVDNLLQHGYKSITATDLSWIALKKLESRIGKGKAEFIADDLTHPDTLLQIAPVDLWIDRAVLHFFTQENDQDTYFDLLNKKINSNGYALFAEYNIGGAKVCAGLPVHRYNLDMLTEKLGNDFELIDSFDHTFITPSGSERPYVYALFRKK